jgi:molecular chaperone DnaJ
VIKVQQSFFGNMQVKQPCPLCHGSGKVPETPCEVCHGLGVVKKDSHEKVKIPAGSYDGMVMKFAGRGNAYPSGASGDLYVKVNVKQDLRFERNGFDIYSEVDVPVELALLGGEIEVDTVVEKVRMKIPQGTQPNQIFKLDKYGLPHLGNASKKGDHYVKVVIKIPKKLSRKSKKLIEEAFA